MPNSNDIVELQVGSEVIKYFKSYSINDDMFSIEDQFSMQLGHPYSFPQIHVGEKCTIKVNGKTELVGNVDSVELRTGKAEKSKAVSGRDALSTLADSYVPSQMWGTRVGQKLEDFVRDLLDSHSELKKIKVVFGDLNSYKRDYRGLPKGSLLLSPPLEQLYSHISPGQTYLDVLKAYCTARGYVFYGHTNNTLVFGYPKISGEADFKIWHGVTPPGGYQNGVALEGSLMRDVSSQYSEILVVSQRQDLPGDRLETNNPDLYIFPEVSPVYSHHRRQVKNIPGVAAKKLFVTEAADDIEDLAKYAELIEKQMSFDAMQLEYVVQGHSQNGQNWRNCAICYVEDEIFNIKGNYLIYSKTFEMSKDSGTVTILRLCTPGSLQNAI